MSFLLRFAFPCTKQKSTHLKIRAKFTVWLGAARSCSGFGLFGRLDARWWCRSVFLEVGAVASALYPERRGGSRRRWFRRCFHLHFLPLALGIHNARVFIVLHVIFIIASSNLLSSPDTRSRQVKSARCNPSPMTNFPAESTEMPLRNALPLNGKRIILRRQCEGGQPGEESTTSILPIIVIVSNIVLPYYYLLSLLLLLLLLL